MVTRRRSITLLAALFMLVSTAFSQDEAPVRFRIISIGDAVSLLYDEGTETQRVYASSGAFSNWLTAPDNRRVVLYQEYPSATNEGAPVKKKLADVKLPAGPGPFLILVQQKDDSQELQARVMDHSLETHPAANYRLINLSKRRMAVRLADENMILDSGQTELTPYPDGRKTWLKIAVNDKESGWIKVVSKPRPVDNTTRMTIIILDIPPSKKDPNPIGILVREAREKIIEDPLTGQSVM